LANGKFVFEEEEEDDVDDDSSPVRNDSLRPMKGKRCFDFPPYYYKPTTRRKDNKKLRVRISSGAEDPKVYERESMMTSYAPFEQFSIRMLESVENSATRTRLLDNRSYGSKEPYQTKNIGKPPSLDDIASASRKNNWIDVFWISLPARVATFVAAYFSFPYFTQVFNSFVTMKPDQLVS
jgi:hypothetical protein